MEPILPADGTLVPALREFSIFVSGSGGRKTGREGWSALQEHYANAFIAGPAVVFCTYFSAGSRLDGTDVVGVLAEGDRCRCFLGPG
jgi:hypothetical protein